MHRFTGLPSIRAELAWVQGIYALAFGGFLLPGARAGDLLGRRRTYQPGLAIFTVASVMVAISQGPLLMIVARGLQGLGAAILAAPSLALPSIQFPEGAERRRAASLYGAVAGVGSMHGRWRSGRTSWPLNRRLHRRCGPGSGPGTGRPASCRIPRATVPDSPRPW
ncbi:MFS transporter [Frateuria aurantia]